MITDASVVAVAAGCTQLISLDLHVAATTLHFTDAAVVGGGVRVHAADIARPE